MLETGFQIDSLHRAQSFTTYESHVLFALRFMIDCSISGGNWVELKAGAYKLLSMDDSRKQSHCQLEVHINYADIISHPAEGELMLLNRASSEWMSPLTVLVTGVASYLPIAGTDRSIIGKYFAAK